MQFEELEFKPLPKRFKQERINILCLLKVPEEIRDKMPREQLKKCFGNFLLSFNVPPTAGSIYPYQGQLWQLIKPPLQFPVRYNSRQEKHAPIAIFKWVGQYDDLSEVVEQYLQDGLIE